VCDWLVGQEFAEREVVGLAGRCLIVRETLSSGKHRKVTILEGDGTRTRWKVCPGRARDAIYNNGHGGGQSRVVSSISAAQSRLAAVRTLEAARPTDASDIRCGIGEKQGTSLGGRQTDAKPTLTRCQAYNG